MGNTVLPAQDPLSLSCKHFNAFFITQEIAKPDETIQIRGWPEEMQSPSKGETDNILNKHFLDYN